MSDDDVDHPVPDSLRVALSAARSNHLASLDSLRDALCVYIDAQRAQGVPQDRVVFRIHRMLRVEEAEGTSRPDARQAHRIVTRMIEWCDEHWSQPR